jgi:hypothetical protein
MNDFNPLEPLIDIVKDAPTYKETASWCLPADFKVSKLLTAKPVEFVQNKVLEAKPVAAFIPLDWRNLK